MIRVNKGQAPQKLLSDGVRAAAGHERAYDRSPQSYTTGKIQFDFKPGIFGHQSVRAALERDQFGKCCYCEVVIPKPHFASHVEHYRPKAYSQQTADGAKNYPGYYWLTYDWENLFLACPFCNSSNKRNIFPLAVIRNRTKSHHGKLGREKPLLIRPSGPDDPSRHIDFHNEVPVGLTRKGSATITVLGLDSPQHEYRLRHYQRLTSVHGIISSLRNIRSRAVRKIVADATAELAHTIRSDAPFSAMAVAFMRRHPLP
jgi:uncharacterized protein (TIGR02646 family)